jgi:hypothetical protein
LKEHILKKAVDSELLQKNITLSQLDEKSRKNLLESLQKATGETISGCEKIFSIKAC